MLRTFAGRVAVANADRHLFGDCRCNAALRRVRCTVARTPKSSSCCSSCPDGDRRAGGRSDSRQAGAQEKDPRVRPPRYKLKTPRDTFAQNSRSRRAFGQQGLVRHVAAHPSVVKGEKKLYLNVDFYSASTYYALGIPIDSYTPVFAVSQCRLDRAYSRAIRQ